MKSGWGGRKATFAASGICVIGLPQISISPLVGVRIPAMIEIRVVLPQPEGPTSIVSSPAGTSKSIPCSTSTTSSPAGKDLVIPRHRTAMARSLMRSPPKNNRRIDHHDFSNAGEACKDDDDDVSPCRSSGNLPGQLEAAEID